MSNQLNETTAQFGSDLSPWYDAVAIDCRLHDLEQDVERLRVPHGHILYWRHYEIWKARLKRFAGWDAEKPELRTTEAWDTCHSYLLQVYEYQG